MPSKSDSGDNQYKLPNSNDSCMRLRAPTACPKWNEGTEEDKSPPLAQPKRWAYLWVHCRGNWTVLQMVIGKCHIWQDMERSCQACSCQAGLTTSSMFRQDSRVDYCPIAWHIWAVHIAWSIVWHSKGADKTKWWRHDRRWTSETCSWLKQTPWQHGRHWWWTNLLVHLSRIAHDERTLLLVGEGVRYCISYY